MQPEIHVARSVSNDKFTAGVISANGIPVAVSLELPWKGNMRRVSCIPAGEYMLELNAQSPKFGSNCFRVIDVDGRTHILFHPANRTRELLGCLAPGQRFGTLNGEFAVLSSKAALNDIRNAFPGEKWIQLRITDDWKANA